MERRLHEVRRKTNRQLLLDSVFKNQGKIADFHRVNSGVLSEAVSTTLSKLEKDGLLYSSGSPKKWFAKTNIDVASSKPRVADHRYRQLKDSYANECEKALGTRVWKPTVDIANSLNLDPIKVGRALSYLASEGRAEAIMRRHKKTGRRLTHYRRPPSNDSPISSDSSKNEETFEQITATDEGIRIYIGGMKMPIRQAQEVYRQLKTIFGGPRD